MKQILTRITFEWEKEKKGFNQKPLKNYIILFTSDDSDLNDLYYEILADSLAFFIQFAKSPFHL